MNISIGETAILLGVSISTLRRWEKTGKFKADFRTVGGHRRYLFDWFKAVTNCISPKSPDIRRVAIYARVSSYDQLSDLQRQKARLEKFCLDQCWSPTIIENLGSGLNYKKSGFKKLFKMIIKGEVSTLVLTHKDRLLRFGSEIIFDLCKILGTRVILVDETEAISDDENLAKDVLELITVFAARLHGRRSHANRKLQAA